MEEVLNGEQGSASTSGSEKGTRSTKGRGKGKQQPSSNGNQNGSVGEVTNENGNDSKGNREESKRNILDSIRNRKHQVNSESTTNEHSTNEGTVRGTDKNSVGTSSNTQGHSGTEHGLLGNIRDNNRPSGGSNEDPNSDNGSSESNRVKKGKKGFEINVPKLPNLSEAPKKPIQKNDEPLLSKKESNDMKTQLVEALTTAFQYMDKGISFTTKNKADVMIWSSIDKSEIEIIAVTLLEGGMRSKVVATAVRKVTRDFRKLQLGIILVPRFIMTFTNYMENGFALPFGKGE
jgi:hypothetical protein